MQQSILQSIVWFHEHILTVRLSVAHAVGSNEENGFQSQLSIMGMSFVVCGPRKYRYLPKTFEIYLGGVSTSRIASNRGESLAEYCNSKHPSSWWKKERVLNVFCIKIHSAYAQCRDAVIFN